MASSNFSPLAGSRSSRIASRCSRISGFAPPSKMSSVAPGRGLISSRNASLPSSKKSAEARPTIAKDPAIAVTAEAICRVHALRKRGRAHRAAIAKRAARRRRRPLLAEAKHSRAEAIGNEECRDRASSDTLLIIDRPRIPFQPARRDMTAAGAPLALGEPAGSLRGPLAGCRGMRNAEAVELGKEALRRLEPSDRCGVIAEQRPVLGDQRQQFRPILEARAIDQAENGRGGKRGKSAQRGKQSLAAHAACDVAAELAAGMSRRLRIGVGEEIGNERGKTCAPRGLRELSSRDARDQKRASFSLRASGQGRKRRGSRDRPAFPIRSSFRTVRPRCDI